MKYYIGIDVGSISVNFALVDQDERIKRTSYLRSHGKPFEILQQHLKHFLKGVSNKICGVGVTGSGRNFIGHYIRADVIKDEITSHSQAVLKMHPLARTIIEIGGQDSKLILLEDGYVKDFSMNSVCAAGTGSFLDQQASRLKIDIEELGKLAYTSDHPTHISGRCTVFAETDMIHKQHMGHALKDLAAGLCKSLAKNYVATLGSGKVMHTPIVFQGGVAANRGMRKAFNELLETKVIVPKHFDTMGAIGVALMTKRELRGKTSFRGLNFIDQKLERRIRICSGCPNTCELTDLFVNNKRIATVAGKCERYS